MKVAIVIVTFNIDSRIFILQVQAIKRFCKDDNYQIIVFDNSDNIEKSKAIQYHAGQLDTSYKKVSAGSKDFSESHAFAATMSYSILKESFNYFFYLDHDCIPVKDFSVVDRLGEDKIIAGLGQNSGKNTYFWPGCVMWNNNLIDSKLIDFYPHGTLDTGAGLRHVINKYGQDKCIFFDEIYCGNPHFTKGKYNYYSMLDDETYMHFVNASNWNPIEDNEDRINSLINIATEKYDSR